MKKNKIFTAAAILILVAAAVAPIMFSAEDAAAAEADIVPAEGSEMVRTSMLDAGYQIIERDGKEYAVIDGVEYEIGALAGFLIGLAIGALLGSVATYIVMAPDTTGITQEDINKAIRSSEAGKLMAAFDTAKNLASGVLPADATLWKFTAPYWQRASEYYVAEFWSTEGELDADQAIDGISLFANIANYLYSWSEALDQAYNTYLSYPATGGTNWTQSGLSNMDVRIQWDNGGISGGKPITSSYELWADMTQYVSTSDGQDLAYIDTNPPMEGMGDIEWYDTIYYFGSGTTTVTNTETGMVYRLSAGQNNIESIYNVDTSATGKLPAGMYRFESGKQLAGPFVPSGSESAADVRGTLVFGNASGTYYALSAKGDSDVAIHGSNGSKVRDSASLSYQVVFEGPDGTQRMESSIFGTDPDNPGVMYNIIGDYDSLLTSIESVICDVAEDAHGTWSIFDLLEEASTVISPSAIRSMADGIPMSSAEYVAVYMQMMIQTHDIVANNMDAIENGSVNISPESLKLYCYGDIIQNGQVWAENVVFTPYINNTAQSLVVGSNIWAGTGHAMIWWQGDSFASWTGSASLAKYTYVQLDRNTTLDIKNIVHNNQNVNSVQMKNSQVLKYNPGSDVPQPPPQIPQVDGSLIETLVRIIIALSAAVVFLGVMLIDEEYFWLAAILAIAVFALGYLFSGTIADIVTGDFRFGLFAVDNHLRGG